MPTPLIRVDDNGDSRRLAAIFRDIPREMRPEIRKAIVESAHFIAQDARGRAGWSSRIPAAITVKAGFARGKRVGVRIEANDRTAPHARPYEGIKGGTTFRHPVFGNRERWVSQETRPFLQPAVDANGAATYESSHRAVRGVLARHGLLG